jgi:hypothetical protein
MDESVRRYLMFPLVQVLLVLGAKISAGLIYVPLGITILTKCLSFCGTLQFSCVSITRRCEQAVLIRLLPLIEEATSPAMMMIVIMMMIIIMIISVREV